MARDNKIEQRCPIKENALISLCACGVPCRYHGQTHKMGYRLYKEGRVSQLKERYNLIPICPEVIGGLPTPRCPCIVTWNGEVPKVTNKTTGEILFKGMDLTSAYLKGAEWTLWLAQIFKCNKAYLLKKSPSCDPIEGITGRLLSGNGIAVVGI